MYGYTTQYKDKYKKYMIKIGNFNTLKVLKLVDFGAYLDGGNNIEILLPSKYIIKPLQIGDTIDVFIHTDS